MPMPDESPHVEHERHLGRTALGGLIVLVVAIVTLLLVRAVVRDPSRRQAALNGIGSAWGGVEGVTNRATVRLRQRRIRQESVVRAHAGGPWSRNDDVAFRAVRRRIAPIPPAFYAHGAFMGAAPAMLADRRWRRILAFLMPDVYSDVRAALSARGSRLASLIPMFENNPVMCAFGIARLGKAAPAAIEWDVYVDSERVTRWAATADADEKQRLQADILDSLVVAHASATDSMQEQIGICQWSDVRATPKSRLGGVPPGPWLDLFTRALRLSRAEDLDAAIAAMEPDPRSESDEECLKHTFARPLAPRDAVALVRQITGHPHLALMLEIKSIKTTPALLAALVAEFNLRGVHIAGLGSFHAEEVRGLSKVAQTIDGAELAGPREVVFFHYAGDFQQACDADRVPHGVCALFNGASLLDVEVIHGQREYAVKESVVDELLAYRTGRSLQLGIYVQEDDTDARAADLLGDLVRRRPDVFDLGFAWGGLPDEVALAEGNGDHRGFGGQRYLERLGYAKHWVGRPRVVEAAKG